MAEYCSLLLRNWWFWIGVGTGMLRLYEWLSGHPIPVLTPQIKTLIVLALLFIAQYSNYRVKAAEAAELANRLTSASKELSDAKAHLPAVDLTRPQFRLELITTAIGDHTVFIDLVLINRGAPSVAMKWSVSVIPKGTTQPVELPIEPFANSDTVTITGRGATPRTYQTLEQVWRKGQRPVPTGDIIRGWIMGIWNGDPNTLNQFGNVVTVTVEDSLGNEYVLTDEISDTKYFRVSP